MFWKYFWTYISLLQIEAFNLILNWASVAALITLCTQYTYTHTDKLKTGEFWKSLTQIQNNKIGRRWYVFAFFVKSQSKVFINEIRSPLHAFMIFCLSAVQELSRNLEEGSIFSFMKLLQLKYCCRLISSQKAFKFVSFNLVLKGQLLKSTLFSYFLLFPESKVTEVETSSESM